MKREKRGREGVNGMRIVGGRKRQRIKKRGEHGKEKSGLGRKGGKQRERGGRTGMTGKRGERGTKWDASWAAWRQFLASQEAI